MELLPVTFKVEKFGLANPLNLSLKDANGEPIKATDFACWPKTAFEGRKRTISSLLKEHADNMPDEEVAQLRRYARIDHQSKTLEDFHDFDNNWDYVTYFIHRLTGSSEMELDPRPYLGIRDHALLLALGSKDDQNYQVALAQSRIHAILEHLGQPISPNTRFNTDTLIKKIDSLLSEQDEQYPQSSSKRLQLSRLAEAAESSLPVRLCGPFHIEAVKDNEPSLGFQLHVYSDGKKVEVGPIFELNETRLSDLFDSLMYHLRFASINAIAVNLKQAATTGNHLRKAKTTYHLHLPCNRESTLNLTSYLRDPEKRLGSHVRPLHPTNEISFALAVSKAALFFKEADKHFDVLMGDYYEATLFYLMPKPALKIVFHNELSQQFIESYQVSDVSIISALSEHQHALAIFDLIDPLEPFAQDEIAEEYDRISGISERDIAPYSKEDLLHLALLFRAARHNCGYKLSEKAEQRSELVFQSTKFQDLYGFLCSNADDFGISHEVKEILSDYRREIKGRLEKDNEDHVILGFDGGDDGEPIFDLN